MSQTYKSCPKCAVVHPHEVKYCSNCAYDFAMNELISETHIDIENMLRETIYTNVLLNQLVKIQERQMQLMERMLEVSYRARGA